MKSFRSVRVSAPEKVILKGLELVVVDYEGTITFYIYCTVKCWYIPLWFTSQLFAPQLSINRAKPDLDTSWLDQSRAYDGQHHRGRRRTRRADIHGEC